MRLLHIIISFIMTKYIYNITLHFNIKKHSDIEDEMIESFHDTDRLLNINAYLLSKNPSDMVEFLLADYKILDAEWCQFNNNSLPSIKFSFEYNKYIQIKSIYDDLRLNSLEDGVYEGFDNGWVIPTNDKQYEYALLDYRNENCIIISSDII